MTRFGDFAREHPGLVLSLGYLGATAVGMLSSWTLYEQFGLNVFHYAQVSDFVLAAVRMPMATVSILLAIPAVWLILRLDEWFLRAAPWYARVYSPKAQRLSRSAGAVAIYCVLYGILFAVLYSSHLAASAREGAGNSVEAQLQTGTYLGRDATTPFDAVLLGTTSAYIFLLDRPSGTVTVVPLENLARLSPVREP